MRSVNSYQEIKSPDELEEENAELKSECRRCAHTDRLCVLSDYGKDRNGICDHFKDVFDEVAELKGLKDVATLIKAKELLKRWVNSYGYIDVALCNQTDQFIKE